MTFRYEVAVTAKNNQLTRDTPADDLSRLLGEELSSAISDRLRDLPWVVCSELRVIRP